MKTLDVHKIFFLGKRKSTLYAAMSNYITKTFQKKLYVDTKSMFYLKNFFTIFETTKIADFQMKRSPNFFFFQKKH